MQSKEIPQTNRRQFPLAAVVARDERDGSTHGSNESHQVDFCERTSGQIRDKSLLASLVGRFLSCRHFRELVSHQGNSLIFSKDEEAIAPSNVVSSEAVQIAIGGVKIIK